MELTCGSFKNQCIMYNVLSLCYNNWSVPQRLLILVLQTECLYTSNIHILKPNPQCDIWRWVSRVVMGL